MSRRNPSAICQLAGRRVTVMGLGRHGGGLAAARFAAAEGAWVTVTDTATETDLADSIRELAGLANLRLALGRHDEVDFRSTDLVVVNPAVRPEHPLLAVARDSGAVLTSEIELFFERCRAPVIGVTGSNGKSTTAAMTAAIMQGSGIHTWLGGNIGVSLLPHLSEIGERDWVVLELSSFQLAHLSSGARLPEIAVVTNCAPNHLDWHGDFEHYRAAKQRLIREQAPSGMAVLNTLDREVSGWLNFARGRIVPPFVALELPDLLVPGEHNRYNAACAAAAAMAAGATLEGVRRGLASFAGLPHRLQIAGEIGGRRFVNDSKATTPEASVAALAAIPGRVWLLAGGSDKGVEFDGLAAALGERVAGVAVFGAVRERLAASILQANVALPVHSTEHLAAALAWCWQSSQAGDTILLSPACASLDQYRDYAARGDAFVALVHELD